MDGRGGQASVASSRNAWACDGQGNYWSDYTGKDLNGDGIGDTPHRFSPEGVDPFPLMAPYNGPERPAVAAGGVVNAVDYSANVCPGTLISVFGRNLAPAPAAVSGGPLPRAIGGVRLEVFDGRVTYAAPLYFVSPSQVNAQLPFEVKGEAAQLRVWNGSVASGWESFAVGLVAPRIFTRPGTQEAIALKQDYRLVAASNPAQPGEAISLYAVGLGAVAPPVASGAVAGDGGISGPLSRTIEPVTVFVGDRAAPVLWAGLAPGMVGVYQVNVLLPSHLESAVMPVTLEVAKVRSQVGVTLACAPSTSSGPTATPTARQKQRRPRR